MRIDYRLYLAAVRDDYAIAYCQPETSSYAHLFGGKKRIKDSIPQFRTDTTTRVGDLNDHVFRFYVVFCLNGQFATIRHRIAGIQKQIQKNLLHLILVNID